MTLGDILTIAAEKDLAGGRRLSPLYEEKWADGKFKIRLISDTDRDAYIHCSVPCEEYDEKKYDYARAYFLSMVFNAAIYGMKRKKKNDKIKPTS